MRWNNDDPEARDQWFYTFCRKQISSFSLLEITSMCSCFLVRVWSALITHTWDYLPGFTEDGLWASTLRTAGTEMFAPWERKDEQTKHELYPITSVSECLFLDMMSRRCCCINSRLSAGVGILNLQPATQRVSTTEATGGKIGENVLSFIFVICVKRLSLRASRSFSGFLSVCRLQRRIFQEIPTPS